MGDIGLVELDAGLALAREVLEGLRDEDLTSPSPCEEWDAFEVAQHLVSLTDFFAETFELGALSRGHEWPLYERSALVEAFDAHAARLRHACADGTYRDATVQLPTGPTSGALAIQVAVGELVVHSWDLAAAVSHDLEAEELAESLIASEWMVLSDEVRNSEDPPFGPARPAPESATHLQRLVAHLGRDPLFTR